MARWLPLKGIDWFCVSPKAGGSAGGDVRHGAEAGLSPAGALPEMFDGLDFELFYLQPMDGPDQTQNIAAAAAYCRSHPRWRLSLQTHKLIGISLIAPQNRCEKATCLEKIAKYGDKFPELI